MPKPFGLRLKRLATRYSIALGGDVGGHQDVSDGNEGDRNQHGSTYAHRYESEQH
jgi:hypothetical protein